MTSRVADLPPPREIACDESGFEGGNLVAGNTGVFAHASVFLDVAEASRCLREIRDRIGSPATEYKAGHLLRARNRPVLVGLLGPSGPLSGRAHVHLTDKTFFVLARLVDLLVGGRADGARCPGLHEPTRAAAVTLYRAGSRAYGDEPWRTFLTLAANLMRTNSRWLPKNPVESFYAAVDRLDGSAGLAPVDAAMAGLRGTRPAAESFRARHLENPKLTPLLEPLIPALVRTIGHWTVGGPVFVVHDEQSALTPERIAEVTALFAGPPEARLDGVRLVDSRTDPRVQIADFLAGVARKVATDELDHSGDADLTALLRPYVDGQSVWADARSWSALTQPSGGR